MRRGASGSVARNAEPAHFGQHLGDADLLKGVGMGDLLDAETFPHRHRLDGGGGAREDCTWDMECRARVRPR